MTLIECLAKHPFQAWAVLLGQLQVETIQTEHTAIGLEPQVGDVARKVENYLCSIEAQL